ncbi:DEKNAAC100565 [Brettanomyces naardenensis]|uniref:1-phosphatidylinositol 4-kinase n=1 Tax=Brettanomyces naardenensis TaxID=13370 RepID=A0A448YGP4_BRENA|nr:DEKNAAC100565 [Brettanomyces naardenensis]
MDYNGIARDSIRAAALKRLANISVQSKTSGNSLQDDVTPTFSRLLKDTRKTSDLSGSPISQRELDTLFALCRSVEFITNKTQAEILLARLQNYLKESKDQQFSSKRTIRNTFPNPWTALTFELTSAIAHLGIGFPSLKSQASDALYSFVSSFKQKDVLNLYSAFSLVGFLQGLKEEISVFTPELISSLSTVFDKGFHDKIETIVDNVSSTDEVELIRGFADSGFEFSSLLFIYLCGELCTEFFKKVVHVKKQDSLTNHMLQSDSIAYNISDDQKELVKQAVDAYSKNYEYINESPDKVISSTPSRRSLANTIRAKALDITLFGYVASVVEFDYVRSYVAQYLDSMSKLADSNMDYLVEMVNSDLLMSTFAASALLSESDRTMGLLLTKYFPLILSYPIVNLETAQSLTKSVTFSLKSLSEDEIVSSIYSLTNLLSDPDIVPVATAASEGAASVETTSLDPLFSTNYTPLEAQEVVCRNVVSAVLEITRAFDDESINILVITLLSQKIRKKPDEFNCILLEGLVDFIDIMEKHEFMIMLRYFYDAAGASFDEPRIASMTMDVWIKFSERLALRPESELYKDYLQGLLSSIISKGDLDDLEHHRSNTDVAASALQIENFLKPLAHLLPDLNDDPMNFSDKTTVSLFKEAWFNLCVHGFAYNSDIYRRDYVALRRIAHSTPPLASESSWNRSETSIELNTVLRRSTSKRTEKLHKDTLSAIITPKAIDAKVFETQISRPGLMFLSANLLVEMLRVDCGNCSTSLEYLSDPSVSIAKLDTFVGAIAYYCCSQYINRLRAGGSPQFTVPKVSAQLEQIFICCCHRDESLQSVAFQCADRIVTLIPSSLCHERSAFSMLDILTLLYDSIVDADTHEYEPSVEYKSEVMQINLSLSDSYKWRQKALEEFTRFARKWTTLVLGKCKQDMKSILYTYVSRADSLHRTVNFGVTFALEMAGKALSVDREYYQLDAVNGTSVNTTTAGFLSQFPWRGNLENDTRLKIFEYKIPNAGSLLDHARTQVTAFKEAVAKGEKISHTAFVTLMEEVASVVLLSPKLCGEFVRWSCEIPFLALSADNVEFSVRIWLGIMKEKPEAASELLSEILLRFEWTVKLGIGLYSKRYDLPDSKFLPMEYLPTNKQVFEHSAKVADANIKPHLVLIRLLSSHFEASKFQSDHTLKMFTRMVDVALKGLLSASIHPFSRLARFELISFAVDVLKTHISLRSRDTSSFISSVLDASLAWFVYRGRPPFGSNKIRINAEYSVLKNVAQYFASVTFATKIHEQKRSILLMFLDHEISFLASWLNPLNAKDTLGTYCWFKFDEKVLTDAFFIDGRLAINLFRRYDKDGALKRRLTTLISQHPFKVVNDQSAISFLTSGSHRTSRSPAIVVWDSTSPLDSITHFMPPFNKDPLVLQYAMRSIESFDAHQTFFYVPQIVQTLRYDALGYIRRYILETANVSQLFAHQIIWNMSANSYRDEDMKIPDPIKTLLDDIRKSMIKEFSDTDRDYYEKEFSFFNDVTSISGKLKPYIKKSKAEKKAKIDAEMAKIKLQEGVYLPSNPDGIVVGIDRKSGKPLQSHAKAPFMATFKIKRKVERIGDEETEDSASSEEMPDYEIISMSAIFKVGDDCRQDVLVLQLMAIFRTVWMASGLDVYLYPNRVTAASPGCGIIDVLPNSISRDMLGREAVNGLYEYFITQFGPQTSSGFQRARNNFVKSMASYSIITYLLAIKDRHNGNIMYDNQGHILHVDFGFCFDIAPGGVTFEQSPFKLTREMVQVMGGSSDTQAFRWFEELCVKGFLVCRQYMDAIVAAVEPMLDSGLPCFKAGTIKRLEARFVPNKSAKDAAGYMRGLIRKSYESLATKGYDEFQKITNGIPY